MRYEQEKTEKKKRNEWQERLDEKKLKMWLRQSLIWNSMMNSVTTLNRGKWQARRNSEKYNKLFRGQSSYLNRKSEMSIKRNIMALRQLLLLAVCKEPDDTIHNSLFLQTHLHSDINYAQNVELHTIHMTLYFTTKHKQWAERKTVFSDQWPSSCMVFVLFFQTSVCYQGSLGEKKRRMDWLGLPAGHMILKLHMTGKLKCSPYTFQACLITGNINSIAFSEQWSTKYNPMQQ